MDLQDSLQGNMREIIGTLSLKEINTDRDSFSDQVMLKASKDMDKLGIEILSCNIQNVTDDNGLIRDLGADNTSKTPLSQRPRQTVISPSPKRKRTNLPMMPAYLQRQRSRRKTTSWRSVNPSCRSTPIQRKQKQMPRMRSRSRNRKRPSRQLP